MLNNIQKQITAMANRHMRRSAVSAGRVLFPIQKTTWKAGETEAICLHGGLRLCHIGQMAKTLGLIWSFKNKKSAIYVARLTIHEVDVRNRPYFSDKLVEDWRWQKR